MYKDRETIIKAKTGILHLNIRELLNYHELILVFVKRNYITRYKQTFLGPLWILIAPCLTIIAYSVVFGKIAGLSTDGIPRPVFYLIGNIMWTFFSVLVTETSNTFISNTALFGKIYFPRLVVPISNLLTRIIDWAVQFALLMILILFYWLRGASFSFRWSMLITPLLLLQLGILGIGIGIIISSLTTRYRDLIVLVSFGLQIWMYATPIIYSIAIIPDKYLWIYMLNPVTPIILIFKYAFLGIGFIPYVSWGISWLVTLLVLFGGIIMFNQVEKTFMDTV